jgi:hypothetical protein
VISCCINVVSLKAIVMNDTEIELFRYGPLSFNKSSLFVQSSVEIETIIFTRWHYFFRIGCKI